MTKELNPLELDFDTKFKFKDSDDEYIFSEKEGLYNLTTKKKEWRLLEDIYEIPYKLPPTAIMEKLGVYYNENFVLKYKETGEILKPDYEDILAHSRLDEDCEYSRYAYHSMYLTFYFQENGYLYNLETKVPNTDVLFGLAIEKYERA